MTEESKRHALLTALKGQPLEFVSSLSRKDKKSWRHLKDKLAKRYDRVLPASSARQVCSLLKQSPEESLMDFGARVTEAVEQGYGQQVDEDVKEELVSEFFLKGCLDKGNACKALERQPNTLKKALEYMERYAYTSSFIYGKHPAGVGVNAVHGSQMNDPVNWSANTVFKDNHYQSYQGQQEQGRRNVQRRCYACDQIGHIKRDCRNVTCFLCHQHGHRGTVCPNNASEGPSQGVVNGDADRSEGAASRVNSVANVTTEGKHRKPNLFEVDVQIEGGEKIKALIDTGAEVTMLNSKFKNTVKGRQRRKPVQVKGILSDGRCQAEVMEDVRFWIEDKRFTWTVCFLPMEYGMILGADFLSHNNVLITPEEVTVLGTESIDRDKVPSESSRKQAGQQESVVEGQEVPHVVSITVHEQEVKTHVQVEAKVKAGTDGQEEGKQINRTSRLDLDQSIGVGQDKNSPWYHAGDVGWNLWSYVDPWKERSRGRGVIEDV